MELVEAVSIDSARCVRILHKFNIVFTLIYTLKYGFKTYFTYIIFILWSNFGENLSKKFLSLLQSFHPLIDEIFGYWNLNIILKEYKAFITVKPLYNETACPQII